MTAPVFVERVTANDDELEHRLVVAEVSGEGEPVRLSAQLVCLCGCVLDAYGIDADPREEDWDEILARVMESYVSLVPSVVCPACGSRATFTPNGVSWTVAQ